MLYTRIKTGKTWDLQRVISYYLYLWGVIWVEYTYFLSWYIRKKISIMGYFWAFISVTCLILAVCKEMWICTSASRNMWACEMWWDLRRVRANSKMTLEDRMNRMHWWMQEVMQDWKYRKMFISKLFCTIFVTNIYQTRQGTQCNPGG